MKRLKYLKQAYAYFSLCLLLNLYFHYLPKKKISPAVCLIKPIIETYENLYPIQKILIGNCMLELNV